MSEIPAGFIAELCRERERHRVAPGTREACEAAGREVLGFLFPHLAPAGSLAPPCEDGPVRAELSELRGGLERALALLPDGPPLGVAATVDAFLARLPELHALLLEDGRALTEGDPAAHSLDEVLLAYPGFRAVAFYRIAHELHALQVPLAPRLITELAHRETGVDIHPGATIGRGLAIDHGTGVVIGETAVIGHRVKLYQGVTIGAASVRKQLAGKKRHPTLGDDVIVYSNATILGGDTHVGEGSVIGGNVWLPHSVPPQSVVTNEGAVTRVRNRGDEPALEFEI
jgi:serine O-acetyltransferase